MGYAVIDPAELPAADDPDREASRRSISDAVGLTHLGAHVYEAAPGETIPLAYHYHEEQEELFYVLSGTLSLETPEEDLAADAGELIVVEPGSPQRAYVAADADEAAEVLAIGAPSANDAHPYEP
ncbi:cupin domain-containing protein [Salinarchaeum laminariae]|uniref:cupin domain-containing protein n=1 Tax=Salinarchaeum laminariae TaxID=869888 RepID=UPI0020C0F6D3|nr:cupin domain-containing protein [Salinarchaeum laminariae]